MQDFVPESIITWFKKRKKKKKKKEEEKENKRNKEKKSIKTAFSFNAMANKNHVLLTQGNMKTPKSLWYETNCTSRLSPNQILRTNTYIRRK